ncbi:MAG: DNA helicase, partial [Planctomycetes bacterium]|nr:DNA helicase [Planctomycetota bacterium]
LGLLERELKKQRRHKPVRRLFAEIPGLLQRLSPCMLMSPLSVAQFLGRGAARFDLVVFDEASQIPMWDAVGSIGRGRSLIVVGDSRQLPPTTFFQRLAQGDEPAVDDLPEDLESVLDECGAAGLPRLFLDWHYRSRHESLIAFSNHHYYKNRLLTFPAPQAIAPGLGVRSVQVAGVYDRAGSQQNRIEAVALVDEVVARLADPARARHSLGIVTFSRAQQVLIEDLLDAARRERPAIEPAFARADEPLFVKNLENVQGDERDTILFSICYGPDAAGKTYENYGPLNQQGGERRLNVAVTRARRELVVFTSLCAEQVAVRTDAIGARHLRAFLDYATRGEVALAAAVAADPSSDVESPFEAAVKDALVSRGHQVHSQVGCSGYRIDLAVVDPTARGRYLLGIECDGRSYHSSATARDRDRLRAAVLQGLGWRLCRVWSTDFWQDAAGEIERIEAAIAAAAVAVAEPAPLLAGNSVAEPAPTPETTPE